MVATRAPSSLADRLRSWRNGLRALPRQWRLRAQVKRRDFTVVSSNCWGAEIYRDLRMPYLTPFVGLFLLPDDYLELLENFPQVLLTPLTFATPGRIGSGPLYPVGLLDGRLAIHFVHYSNEAEARDKWERRRARMTRDMDRTFFMFCDRDGAGHEHLERFDRLRFPHKVAFISRPVTGLKNAVVVPPNDAACGCVDEGPALYRQCQRHFPLAAWLNDGGSSTGRP